MLSRSPSKLQLHPTDTIIALMGPTGSGKSLFINTATGQGTTDVGHTLHSRTTQVQSVRCRHPSDPNRSIVFIDTPSFNNTDISDSQVLTSIAEWLQKTYKDNIKLSGIIYTHRITDNRMAGSPLRNLRLFENLCGEDAVQNVLLASTMWNDRLTPGVGEAREQELMDKYWRSMIEHGSKTARYDGTHESAWTIVDQVLRNSKPRSLLLQKEMVDEKKPLQKTKAGIALALDDVQWMLSDFKDVETWASHPLPSLRFRRIFF
ncbi:hypothetical protein ONZ45_g4420 [Pleurotus djamor]|nr:hypothetical protein ONZ45_g4420 [Pleurotus djamor]